MSRREKVVYILGAGFSAPLGIPVIRNFLEKSKDMYLNDQEKYPHFRIVFDQINEMSRIKNFYDADLSNIEEILSIMEMTEFVTKEERQTFVKYIKDVIAFYTPKMQPYTGSLPSNWEQVYFQGQWRDYGHFVMNLCGIMLLRDGPVVNCCPIKNQRAEYGVISLNYDCVLENVQAFISNNAGYVPAMNFTSSVDVPGTALAKLHGDIECGVIVPPTWSKGRHEEIIPAWKLAHKLIGEANQIRILGYSLPAGDSYVRYLLKSSAMKSDYLRQIDILCKDDSGEVEERYEELIRFPNVRFANDRVQAYLERFSGYVVGSTPYRPDQLEEAHKHYFEADWRPKNTLQQISEAVSPRRKKR